MPEEPDESPPPPSPEEATELMTPPTGGASILPASAAPLQEIIGDFEVLGKLGAGGMGAVYRARQISLHREVALKVLPAQFIEDADSVARFQREARVAASLSHANLVRVYSAGQAEGVHYIAMELIEGEDLGRRLKQGGRLAASEALRITAEVARGLDYAWRHAQLIHRDIKPANIFLAAGGAVKAGDLGLAKSVLGHTTGLTQTGTLMGTPHYISPEQARGDKEIDFRADIYSLGCTLYHMLTGQVPYGGSEAITIIRQHLDAPLPAILKVWPQCPIPLARLVGRMLKKSRHERPASYAELLTQIESVWAQIDPQSYAPEAFAPPPAPDPNATLIDQPLTPRSTATIPPQSAPPPRKSPLPRYAGIAAALAVLALAAYLLWPKPAEKLTQAQIYARDHAAELAAQAAPTPAPPAPKPAPEPAAIKLWDSPDKLPSKPSVTWEGGAVRLAADSGQIDVERSSLWWSQPKSRDVILRAKVHWSPRPDALQIQVRRRPATGKDDRDHTCVLEITEKEDNIRLCSYVEGQQTRLKSWPFTRRADAGEWALLETRVVGDEWKVFLDGEVIANVRSDHLPQEAGAIYVLAGKGGATLRDIEYIPLDGTAASAPPTAEPWQDLLRQPERLLFDSGAALTAGGQLLLPGKVNADISGIRLREGVADGALRATASFDPAKSGPQLRARNTANARYLAAVNRGSTVSLARYQGLERTLLAEWPLAAPLVAGADYTLELRSVGPTLSVRLDGQTLGTVQDATLSGGSFAVTNWGADPLTLRSVQLLPLPASTPGASSAERWQDVLRDPARLGLLGSARLTPEGMRFDGGGVAFIRLGSVPARDGAVRLRARFVDPRPKLHARGGDTGTYQFSVQNATTAVFERWDRRSQKTKSLLSVPLPQSLKRDQDYEMELRIVGQTLTGKINGVVVGTVSDSELKEGNFAVAVTEREGLALITSLEVLDLDAPAP